MLWNQCDNCYKFAPYANFIAGGGGSWCFVPGTDIPGSYEEDVHRCRTCTQVYGAPLPQQRVRVEICSGVY